MTEANDRAVLIGLIGHGVGPSLTPRMHELEGARHGLRHIYRTVELSETEDPAAELERLLTAAETFGFDGLNLTHPVKQTAIPLLDELSDPALRVEAVNTVVWRQGRRVGHNTDVSGFAASLEDAIGPQPRGRVVLLGAGGAGSAAAHALASAGLDRLTVVDVDRRRAEEVAGAVAQHHEVNSAAATPHELPTLLPEANGLVNATPIGMAHHPGSPVPRHHLHPGLWVCDVIYRPVDTPLLLEARSLGCRTVSGLGMAMHQAAEAFEIFTGEPADRKAMLSDLQGLVAAEQKLSPTPR
ncbi:shikimate dehydrogenase [Nesterenkonia xinjiangensis]|uniref:Shikimate dehydrogenase (NADP(+)) n=1 Tax=Nesterenkonia xinjiangensis TaxID=225327 RepID=A0A7Z0GJ26_9MICC|nr:shikimate dehydrogenase [Nesterenkonia xinjiangensis]